MTYFGMIANNARTTARDVWMAEMQAQDTNWNLLHMMGFTMAMFVYSNIVIRPHSTCEGYSTGPANGAETNFVEGYSSGDMKCEF